MLTQKLCQKNLNIYRSKIKYTISESKQTIIILGDSIDGTKLAKRGNNLYIYLMIFIHYISYI